MSVDVMVQRLGCLLELWLGLKMELKLVLLMVQRLDYQLDPSVLGWVQMLVQPTVRQLEPRSDWSALQWVSLMAACLLVSRWAGQSEPLSVSVWDSLLVLCSEKPWAKLLAQLLALHLARHLAPHLELQSVSQWATQLVLV